MRPRLRWWREVLYVAAFYGLYTLVRNRGLSPNEHVQAFHNAKRVIAVERFVGGFHERYVQHLFLGWHWFIRFWDVYYGTFHFIVTIVALVWLFRRMPERYPLWRNTLACTTALALIGFAFFPLMPPRLLPAGNHYGFVDTLEKVRRPVVVRLGHDAEDLQPVRGDAQPALRLVELVRPRAAPGRAPSLVEGPPDRLPVRSRCSPSSSPPTTTGSTPPAARSC